MSMSDAEPIKGEVQDMGSASGSGSPDEMLDDAHDVHEHDGSLETPPPPPKRKGGRKPIYATSEERKQRNRQAQAAFRERRTEYIKQLEITLKQNEETIQNLRRSNRSGTEECHLLRYRNSLLERIMIEKGFDVQAEMQLRGASPTTARPQHASPTTADAPIAQQAMLNRHQQAMRQPAPKLDQAFEAAPPMHSMRMSPSATSQSHSHTPTSSQFPSPAQTYRQSPGGFSTTAGSFVPQQVHQTQPQQQLLPEHHHQHHQQHHQAPPPPPQAQYPYQSPNSWPQEPFRAQEQHYPQQDVSSYGYSDMNQYNQIPSMADGHHQQMMHQSDVQHIGKLNRPYSMPLS